MYIFVCDIKTIRIASQYYGCVCNKVTACLIALLECLSLVISNNCLSSQVYVYVRSSQITFTFKLENVLNSKLQK